MRRSHACTEGGRVERVVDPEVELRPGRQPAGRPLHVANHDMSVSILTYGGIVQAVNVPDRRGQQANVALNFAAIANYTRNGDYRGATAGRYANRIPKGRFTLDNTQYSLDINNNPNTLHGGFSG